MDVLFQRHYVSNPSHVEALREISDRTIDASRIVGDDALLCVRVSYRPTIDDSTYFDICKQLSRLKGHVFSTVLGQSTETPGTSYNGAGTALSSVLFNSIPFKTIDKEEPVITSMDGDQYPINDVSLIEATRELSKRLKNHKTAFGLGARTHIRMSADPETDKLRKLHEMFQSHMIHPALNLSNPNPENLDLSDVPLCYKELGESTPGFYTFNHGSNFADVIRHDVKESAIKADFRGFALDYYLTPLIASKKQQIEYVYVPTDSKHPNVKHSKDAVERLIKEQTHEVLQTNIRNFFLQNIKSGDTVRALNRYFDESDVKYVQGLMLHSI